ncbi:MAG TPA: L,D-transpeptidase family protein, partial [Hyphomicrobiales bacterium]|nr:L,D-transpeptidase family protein [Hyphomicrobiales bacterium]
IPLPWATPSRVATDAAAARLHDAIAAKAQAAGGDVAKFYAARADAPLWTDAHGLTARGRAARERIAAAADDGLDPAAFHLPPASIDRDDPDAVAAAEVGLSAAAVAYARTAAGGRIDPSRLGPNVEEHPWRPAPAEVLAKLAAAPDVARALDGYNPQEPAFQALRRKLAALRGEERSASSLPVIPEGTILRPGMTDDRVALLRTRLGMPEVESDADPDFYDDQLADAVRAFQERQGLADDANVGRNTLAALNAGASPVDPLPLVLANMERWRWLPRDLGATHVIVNVPEFMVRIVRDGQVVHEAKIVDGKPTNQTPIFSNAIQFIVVNPYWHVPKSIAAKEVIPHLMRDPSYLARQDMQVIYRGRPVDPGSVPWGSVNLSEFQFRQNPGAENALGRIKFLFPNRFSVYLHDTPEKRLFQRTVRDYSHGCMRVQDPFAFAAALLEGTSLPVERIQAMVGGGEKWVKMPVKIPIHIVYFTAAVGPDGTLVTRPDIYGYDRSTETALGVQASKLAAR